MALASTLRDSPPAGGTPDLRESGLRDSGLRDCPESTLTGSAESAGRISPGGHTLVLAVTGASGAILAVEMMRALEADSRVLRAHVIFSPSALRVLAEEGGRSTGGRGALLERLLGQPSQKISALAHEDIGASVASGSYPVQAMVVLPCSMGTLAGIAHGLASNLIERAADVCLKERRRLILCVRETPLNLIHLRNMAAAAEAGATIFPVIPTFYNHPQTVEDMARNYVHRVLQHLGLPQPGAFTWGSEAAVAEAES